MLISEKGLCRAMSDAAAHGGYRLRFNVEENTMTVMSNVWLVNVESASIPRKVLALIVEHFGYLPTSGCYSIEKTKDSFSVQVYMNDAFNMDVANIAMGSPEPALYTGISVWGKALYISESGKMQGVDSSLFGLLTGNPKPMVIIWKSLTFMDDESAVFLAACGSEFLPDVKRPIWDSLEKIDWWKAKEAEPTPEVQPMDEGEQLALEERDTEGGDE